MPILVALLVAFGLVALFVLLIPVSLVMRYRVATSRRRHRTWVVSVNVFSLAISASLLMGTAMVMSFWVVEAVPYVVAGFLVGAVLGLLGLAVSRWDEQPEGLYVTGNRWLVLLLSAVIIARIALGFWRAWSVWGDEAGSELAATAVAGSMAAGAVLVGYSLVYWIGVRAKLKRSSGSFGQAS